MDSDRSPNNVGDDANVSAKIYKENKVDKETADTNTPASVGQQENLRESNAIPASKKVAVAVDDEEVKVAEVTTESELVTSKEELSTVDLISKEESSSSSTVPQKECSSKLDGVSEASKESLKVIDLLDDVPDDAVTSSAVDTLSLTNPNEISVKEQEITTVDISEDDDIEMQANENTEIESESIKKTAIISTDSKSEENIPDNSEKHLKPAEDILPLSPLKEQNAEDKITDLTEEIQNESMEIVEKEADCIQSQNALDEIVSKDSDAGNKTETKTVVDVEMDSLNASAQDVQEEECNEAMDTCDSQESLNLIIDESAETAENESLPKDAGVEHMDTSENVKPNEGSNQIDEAKENISNDQDDDGKDDDVIAVEQPPMPVIEIDDDDDDEDDEPPKQSPLKDTPIKEVEKVANEVAAMSTQETECEIVRSVLEDFTALETDISKDGLLTAVAEKSMEEIIEEEKTNLSSSNVIDDTTDEIFYNKECVNYECPHKHKQFFRVPNFAFSYFKVNKKKFKTQYICSDCYDKALDMFEEYCGLINAKQPLLMEQIPSGRQEFVEIIDSSDEEDTVEPTKDIESAKSAFSSSDLSLIERELHNTIKNVLERVEIQNQLTWSKTILSERLKRLQMETDYVDSELRSLQRKADKMHEGLYACPKIKIRQLQPLDLNSGKIMGFESHQHEMQSIPPVGEIERPPIQTNGTYYAVKNNAIASWVPSRVVEQVDGSSAQKAIKYYRIRYLKSSYLLVKTVPSKFLAYYEPPTVRLPIGTRVIAFFDATSLARGREKMNVQSAFYPGIIAEPLKPNNKFRYLIFYDDGYTQYVYHKDVRLVCHVSENVWEDVHSASRDFIQKYLTQYSINRPMVQTQKGQSMNTESNGYWLHARVVDIDCSLVLMQFEGSKSHTEWIYRGSLRLGPVFKEYQKSLQKNTHVPVSRRRTEPFIRYTEDEESQQQSEKSDGPSRAVARKSFGRPEPNNTSAPSASLQREHAANVQPVKHLNNSTIYLEDENKPKGKVVYYTAKRNLPPVKYTPHVCSNDCLFEITHNLSAYSPLSKPLLSGWERFIIRQKIKKVVTYRAPCGKICRNMKELHHYLRLTENTLNVDNFDFSPETSCLAEYVVESAIVQKRDISCGQEKMAIPLVNYYDNTLPPECKYSAKVIPTEGVHINKDPEFFAGCDCDDDCSDKSKCSCWQLTIAGAKYGNPNIPIDEIGYQYKRLLDHVPTGIYECNPRCKCKQNCLNRVVQHSLQLKLQVFKTSNRGWGLRCINDVPRGTFVCVYAGHLLTEAKANEGGQDAGDEYFAELDYIEVAEQIKEGYESEVEPPDPDDEDPYQPELDDDFTPSRSFLTRSKRNSANSVSTRQSGNQEDDSQERQVINFDPNADMNEDSVRENSIRKLYGKDEACYVMDAKISGNLGRYFNHSCAPNMFVQNVFVDTHDLRFPWVAFFASSNIRAGSELTWNYNYEVGVVPGKVLYCQCGAPTCRLRLL